MTPFLTLFDASGLPMNSAIFKDGVVHEFDLYRPGTGLSIYDIEQNEEKIKQLIGNDELKCNDPIRHRLYFKIHNVIYDCEVDTSTSVLGSLSAALNHSAIPWKKLLGEASRTYAYLMWRGLYNYTDLVHPQYDNKVFSGRSRTTGFNVQGCDETYDLRPINNRHQYFVHFDWVAADWSVIAVMSRDDDLRDAFAESDPYTYVAGDSLNRDECKLDLLRSLYSMNYESTILEFYPKVKDWMHNLSDSIDKNGFSESILGRKFRIDGEHTNRSVFNAAVQGSVAHAMQNVLGKLFNMCPVNLFAEVHDSIIETSDESDIKELIDMTVGIMRRPFDGILDVDHVFPVKVSIGNRWKKWRPLKTYR